MVHVRTSPGRRWLLLLVGLVVAVAVVPAVASAQSTEQDRLSQAKQRIERLGDEIEQAEARADDVGAALGQAQERLDEVEAVVNEVARTLERQRVAVEDAARELERVERQARQVRDSFSERVTEMFKQGTGVPFQALFGADNVRDALDRSSFLQSLAESDRATIEELDTAQVAVSAQRERLTAEQERLETMQVEQQELLAEVGRIRDTRAAAAAEAAQHVAELESERDDLEADQERLEELIEKRQTAPASMGTPSKSGYIWPTCGPVTSEYGYRWGRRHAGVDVGAGAGAGIVAAKSGSVIYAGYQGGYGRLTLIDHGDGVVTAYAHQSSIQISVGQAVDQGQRIGSVGSSGNSTGPHLHFETRVNGSAVNPRGYLSGSPC